MVLVPARENRWPRRPAQCTSSLGMVESLEARALLAAADAGVIQINFQPSAATVPAGYYVDSGLVYGARNGLTYGWTTSHIDAVFDRNRNGDQSLDTLAAVKKGAKWQIALPNGQYNVSFSIGDAASATINNVWLEEKDWVVNYVSLAANQFLKKTSTVSVGDGKLTIGIGGAANLATRLNYITIASVPTAPPSVPPTPSPTTTISWSTVASSPMKRAEAVGNVVDGKLYVMSGFNGTVEPGTSDHWIAPARSDVYNPATNTWSRIADMPEVFTHATGVVVGKVIWFVGGYSGNHPGSGTTHVWKYDTVSNSWSRGPDLPSARGAGGAALIGNTIYYTAGMNAARTENRRETWALDVTNPTAQWVAKAPIPTGRNHLGVIAFNGKLWAIGGQLSQEETTVGLRAMEYYDPATNKWTAVARLPVARSHLTAGVFVHQGRICFAGGDPGHDNPKREVYAYNPVSNSWSIIGYLPAVRSTVVAGVLPNGKLIVSTGNGPGPTATTWIGTLK